MPRRRSLRFLERGESVLLFGPVGVGKTHVAQALGHLACRRGYSVLFAKTSRVLAELAGGRADGSWVAAGADPQVCQRRCDRVEETHETG